VRCLRMAGLLLADTGVRLAGAACMRPTCVIIAAAATGAARRRALHCFVSKMQWYCMLIPMLILLNQVNAMQRHDSSDYQGNGQCGQHYSGKKRAGIQAARLREVAMAVPALAALEMRRLRLLDGDAGIDRVGGQEVCSVRVKGPS